MTICLRVLVWKIENLVDTWIEQAGVVMSYRSWWAPQCVPVLILELSQSESCFWRTSNFGLLMMLIHPHMKASGSSERRKLWTQHGRSFKCNVSDSKRIWHEKCHMAMAQKIAGPKTMDEFNTKYCEIWLVLWIHWYAKYQTIVGRRHSEAPFVPHQELRQLAWWCWFGGDGDLRNTLW